MSDDTLISRLTEMERENAELRKTSKADIDARAERLGMRCSNCSGSTMYDLSNYICNDIGELFRSEHYCKLWSKK